MTNTANENRKYLEAVSQELKDSYNNGEIYEYINNNVLDVEYSLNSLKELIGVNLYITLGGPTVWIDTRDCTLTIAWGCERDQLGVYSDICEEITTIFADDFSI